ncbi:superoxide dismutase [Lysinibacillus alkalisoli]|uniref:Superoxide dismutase n=1 Tax=Lysinibacillus alkalisoli TaxID=1911548 RepID=A0A917LJF1_9BACI|nr:superoxide dismutase [Lysinibacillus alkalisoli]GGG30928.1 superoxide dismutase [Lysinibacillus alkalisoli]
MTIFELPKLPYAVDALEPYLDARTLEIHHGKHHATYVNNLNAALEGHNDLQSKSIREILTHLDQVPEDIRTAVQNNGGGHYCHSLFWESMKPNGGGEPTADIKREIEKYFHTFDNFQDQLSKAAVSRFGSGYGWLVEHNGQLEVLSTANQNTPLQEGKNPLLIIDVWEHAYYLKYQNRRPEFVTNWWHTIDWDIVNDRLLQTK